MLVCVFLCTGLYKKTFGPVLQKGIRWPRQDYILDLIWFLGLFQQIPATITYSMWFWQRSALVDYVVLHLCYLTSLVSSTGCLTFDPCLCSPAGVGWRGVHLAEGHSWLTVCPADRQPHATVSPSALLASLNTHCSQGFTVLYKVPESHPFFFLFRRSSHPLEY